uniref:ankyrin repeat and protein kinase domain-containing protein 1-like isoform X1 n=2 Tax=Myxine glutinosa TaxID=7769 RepID=UPI00358DF2B4
MRFWFKSNPDPTFQCPTQQNKVFTWCRPQNNSSVSLGASMADVDGAPREEGSDDSNPLNPQAAVAAEKLGLQVVTKDDLVDLQSVGSGGFGEVFKGKHNKWQNMVAVKKFKEALSESDLSKEIINLMKAQFLYTVQLLGLYMESVNISGLVLEWMSHGSLEDFHKKVEAGWALRLRFLHEVALGMNYLHCMEPKHLLHLDLKPANILLNEHLNIKIADFGLCEVHQTTSVIIAKDVIKGTVPYMAPEQFNINEKQSRKWDIYSYAVVIWAVVTHSEPYEDVEAQRIMMLVVEPYNQRPTIPQETPPDPDLITLMKECWDKDPKKRPLFDECTKRMEMMQKGVDEIKQDVDKALSILHSPLPQCQIRSEDMTKPIQEQVRSDTIAAPIPEQGLVENPKIIDLDQKNLRRLYGRTPSLDPKSAHPQIEISLDRRKATLTKTKHPYLEHPDRFDFWEQVLSSESFSSGRHYWEIHVGSSRSCRLGIALNSMGRKGEGNKRLLGVNPESWCIQKYKNVYTVLQNQEVTVLSVPREPERVGFLLDCEAGELTCFGDSQILHVFRGKFTDPVKPAIGVYAYFDDSVWFCSM